MSGRKGMKTGVPADRARLKECDKMLKRTIKKHLGRSYEELFRIDSELYTYWERNHDTLVSLISKGPLLVRQSFERQRKSVLAFVKWWPLGYGDISQVLLQKNLLREVEGEMRDLKHIEEMLARRPGRPRVIGG